MGASEHGRPRWHPLGMARFFLVIGVVSVAAGLVTLGDAGSANLLAPTRAGDEVEVTRARILADVERLIEARESAGAPKVPNGAVVVPIRNGVPQAPAIASASPPRGTRLAALGAGLLAVAALIYLLFPPPPRRGRP